MSHAALEPKVIRMYMEVDLNEHELPTGRWGYTVRELAEACGVKKNAIESLMSHCKKQDYRCRYVKVEFTED